MLISSFILSACYSGDSNEKPVMNKRDNNQNYNVVNLSQSASKVIESDTLEVVFSINSKNKNRQIAMNEVTERLNLVMKEIKANSSFEAQLLNRNGREVSENINAQRDDKGNPVYTQVWEENVSVLVKSKDFQAMNVLISKIQEAASINSMSFTVSKEKINTLQDELTREGIRRFNEKANLISQEFGGKGYKIVSVNIGNVDAPPYPVPYANFRAESAMMAKSAPVVSDSLPGEKTINLSISGSIELVR